MNPANQNVSQEENVRKDRYLAMLSHDLRSAITNVISGLELMEDEGLDPESLLHKNGALSSARHVTRLIDGILDIRAIDENDFYLDLETVKLPEFMQEIYRAWLGAVASKNLSFEIRKSDNLPELVQMDRGRILRVLGNLLDNAIKYTDAGDILLTVEMGPENSLVFSVRDSGPGFSEEARSRLFEFRGRPDNSKKPGSGLGLHIAKSLVDNMGGTISVDNHPEGGAEISVSFPLVSESGEAQIRQGDNAQPTSVSVLPNAVLPDLSGMKILLAEDNTTNQLVVTQMLDAMGATFDVASDGAEAVEMFDTNSYDLALLDIEMPRLSGLDVIRHIRSRQDSRMKMPVVALTAYALREHREKISEAGADGLIAKPILGIEDFGQAILNHYDRVSENKAQAPQTKGEASETHPVIDQTLYAILERSVGSDKIVELLGKVADDLRNVSTRIRIGLEANDLKEIAAASHVLISVAGAIGAPSVQNAGQMLNRAAHINDMDHVKVQGEASLTGIREILKFVDDQLNH